MTGKQQLPFAVVYHPAANISNDAEVCSRADSKAPKVQLQGLQRRSALLGYSLGATPMRSKAAAVPGIPDESAVACTFCLHSEDPVRKRYPRYKVKRRAPVGNESQSIVYCENARAYSIGPFSPKPLLEALRRKVVAEDCVGDAIRLALSCRCTSTNDSPRPAAKLRSPATSDVLCLCLNDMTRAGFPLSQFAEQTTPGFGVESTTLPAIGTRKSGYRRLDTATFVPCRTAPDRARQGKMVSKTGTSWPDASVPKDRYSQICTWCVVSVAIRSSVNAS